MVDARRGEAHRHPTAQWTGRNVLGRREVGSAADQDAEDLGSEVPQQVVHVRQSVMDGGSSMTGRTSIHSCNGLPPGPGADDR